MLKTSFGMSISTSFKIRTLSRATNTSKWKWVMKLSNVLQNKCHWISLKESPVHSIDEQGCHSRRASQRKPVTRAEHSSVARPGSWVWSSPITEISLGYSTSTVRLQPLARYFLPYLSSRTTHKSRVRTRSVSTCNCVSGARGICSLEVVLQWRDSCKLAKGAFILHYVTHRRSPNATADNSCRT